MDCHMKIADDAFLRSVDHASEDLKNRILHSAASVVIKGTIYHVSENGNDDSDGKSPAAAWKTLSRVNNARLLPGDGVLFDRGGVWRGQLQTKQGVTYSAYGEGDKPIIKGSPENYSQKNKWKETEHPNIYIYDEVVSDDCGLIVFNNGEAWSIKLIAGVHFTGVLTEMDTDLQMYHSQIDHKIYLRSETGNPADRFDTVDFALKRHIVTVGGNDITLDNLCFRYGGAHGVGAGECKGLTVRWCEFGWIGGSIQHNTVRYGNAIEIWGSCSCFTVDQCYIHQIYDAGITHQYQGVSESTIRMTDVSYTNNLITYCTYSIEYFLGKGDDHARIMSNITFRGNIMRFAGYGWGDQRPDKTAAAHIKGWDHMNTAENFMIEDNMIDRGKYMLIHCGAEKATDLPIFNGNTFIQNAGGRFGRYDANPTKPRYFDIPTATDDNFGNNTFVVVCS